MFRSLKTPKGFVQSQKGAVTVEATLWLPFFVAFFCVIADLALIFNGQARMYRIVEDANRQLAIGQLSSAAAAEDFITSAATSMSDAVKAKTTVDNGLISTSTSIPSRDLAVIGFVTALADFDLVVGSQQIVEF